MRAGVVLNRHAGKGYDEKLTDILIKEFEKFNVDVLICETRKATVEEAFKKVASHHPDVIVVGGGDGTISAIVEKLAELNITLGIIPLGTYNHFARDLGIPFSLDEAVKVIADRVTKSIDVAEVNSKVFINNSSIGVYPLAVLLRKGYEKKLGWAKWLAMIRAMARILFAISKTYGQVKNRSGRISSQYAFCICR